MTTILLWRILLDLQAAQRRAACGGVGSSVDGSGDSLVFTRIMGSIDATIRPEDEEVGEWEEGGVIADSKDTSD